MRNISSLYQRAHTYIGLDYFYRKAADINEHKVVLCSGVPSAMYMLER